MQAIPIIGHAVVDDKLPPPAQAASFNNEGIMSLTCQDRPNRILLTYVTLTVVAVRDYLSRKSWPAGLQNALINGLQTTPARFFICDNSGSMRTNDGHRVVGESNALKYAKHCLRFELFHNILFDLFDHFIHLPCWIRSLSFLLIRTRVVPCPRWTELTESLRFHVGLAHAAYAPTEFRMLNGTSYS